MANGKNFSESKISNSVNKCRGCGEVVPKLALAFSNRVAIEQGWCCWMCCLADLGNEKAYKLLEDRAKQNQRARGRL